MWIVLAVLSFALGQLYLFRCLGRLDGFLDTRQPGEDRIVLSVALSDPDTEAGMVGLLEGFCAEHPNVDPVLHIDPEAMCAVREKRADVGLCPETDVPGGLNCLTLTFPEGRSRQLIWNRSRKAGELAEYLWQACSNCESGVL